MDLKSVMQENNFVIVGNTIDETKYAYKIKHSLVDAGYNVKSVGKELTSINDVDFDIDILDLCIHPVKGIELLKENKKNVKCVVIQPGAESDEIKEFLSKHGINFIEGCLLVGLSLYRK